MTVKQDSGSFSERHQKFVIIIAAFVSAMGIIDATALNALDRLTSGVINASSVTTLSGSHSELNTAYSSPGISGLAIDLEGITTLGPSARITGTILTDDAYWQVDDAINRGNRIVLSGPLLDLQLLLLQN